MIQILHDKNTRQIIVLHLPSGTGKFNKHSESIA